MKHLLFIAFFAMLWGKYHRTYEINTLKENAEYLYQEKKFNECAQVYEKLIKEYKETDENLKLNLANCYYNLGKDNVALEKYKELSVSENLEVRSNAFLQMGVLYYTIDKKEMSLTYFKSSLKANPSSETARYNYELLKKVVDKREAPSNIEKKKESDSGKNKMIASTSEELRNSNSTIEQEKKQTSKDKSGEYGDEESSGDEEESRYNEEGDTETDALTSKRLNEVQMTEQQAKLILKVMRNAEIQYVQQQKKVVATKSLPGNPDW